jgi:large subunit ribosomal protein L35Ae
MVHYGIVMNFRRGKQTYKPRHFLIQIDKVDSKKDAALFVGRTVTWKSSAGTIIKGKIAAPHGRNGVVRAIFEKGLPGQALTQKVEIE